MLPFYVAILVPQRATKTMGFFCRHFGTKGTIKMWRFFVAILVPKTATKICGPIMSPFWYRKGDKRSVAVLSYLLAFMKRATKQCRPFL